MTCSCWAEYSVSAGGSAAFAVVAMLGGPRSNRTALPSAFRQSTRYRIGRCGIDELPTWRVAQIICERLAIAAYSATFKLGQSSGLPESARRSATALSRPSFGLAPSALSWVGSHAQSLLRRILSLLRRIIN